MSGDGPLLFTAWSPIRPLARHRLDRPARRAPRHDGPSAPGALALLPAAAAPVPGHLVALDDAVVEQARALAEQLLTTVDDDGRRWRHTKSVAARAEQGRAAVAPEQGNLLLCAAWLHDIGYAPALLQTGFHPLDGAEHLVRELWPPAVTGLVAHHSGSRFVAGVRHLQHRMAPFDRTSYWSGPVADALTWADQTTGPDGERVSVGERLAEMLARHGLGSPQARCHAQRGPSLVAAVASTEERLAATSGTP